MTSWSTDTELQRILRLAFLYGALEQHGGKVYVPGAPQKPLCGEQILRALVSRGWLKQNEKTSRFEITDEGKRAEWDNNRPH